MTTHHTPLRRAPERILILYNPLVARAADEGVRLVEPEALVMGEF